MASPMQVDKSDDLDTEKHENIFAVDADAERRLLWKLDLTLLPICTLIYLLNFLDRTAVGNALVAGEAALLSMPRSLELTS
jgi:hypothetical protein